MKKDRLLKLIKIIKENGVENKKQQNLIRESSLKKISKASDVKFEEIINYGIEKFCLKRDIKKGKSRIVLLSEEILDEDNNLEEKEMGLKIFEIIKESGVENEEDELICNEIVVKRELKATEKDFKRSLEFCVEKGCLQIKKKKERTYFLLLKEDFGTPTSIKELTKRVIKVVKDSKEETEDGYLFLTEESLLEVLKISKSKITKVVENGLKQGLLIFNRRIVA